MDRIIISDTVKIRQFIQLESCSKSDQFFTQLNVLLNLADKIKDKVIFLALKKKGKVYGAGLFSINKRRTLGFSYSTLYIYGYQFFDYNSLLIVSGFEKDLFSFIKSFSRDQGVKLFILDNIKMNIEGINCLKKKEHVYCFDKNKSEDSFSFISLKKSVKRHRNKLINNFRYNVKHLRGNEVKRYLPKLAILHKERWAFDNFESAFDSKQRLSLYDEDLDNRLLTIIFLDEKVLAMHYGMLIHDSLIWHTPVLNIQYLDFSPIEVLLSETATYCQNNQIQRLDFGIGREKYKVRFSNSKDYLYQYYFPISLSTTILVYMSEFIKRFLPGDLIKLSLISVLQKIQRIRNTLNYYHLEKKESLQKLENNDIVFKVIRDFAEFVDFCRSHRFIVRRFQYERLINGDYYFCLMNETHVLCEGWATSKPLYVIEINKTLRYENSYMLYDYHTPLRYRKRGYYKLLLRSIINYLDKNLYIYSLKNNKASNKAILEVGFKKIKSL